MDLALGERPETRELRAARERILDPAVAQHIRRAREQEPPRGWIPVDGLLDRQQQVGDALDLVDHDRLVQTGEEADRVRLCRRARDSVVESDSPRRVVVLCYQARQRALADLARTHHVHDARIGERLEHKRMRMTRVDTRSHVRSIPNQAASIANHIVADSQFGTQPHRGPNRC